MPLLRLALRLVVASWPSPGYQHHIIGILGPRLLESVNCISAMPVSSLWYNAHSWCSMSVSQLPQIDGRLESAYGACIPYKLMHSSSNDKIRRISDQHILSIIEMPEAYRQLMHRRFFLPRLLRADPAARLRFLDSSH